ncbi:MAG: hypothetical protein ACYCW6_12980 [Candidatus Xenobia bacterium]
MIDTISRRHPASHRPLRLEAQEQPSAPLHMPQDATDLKSLDNPVKAALLPITEPATEVALVVGLMNVLALAKQSGGVPLMMVDVNSTLAGKPGANMTYTVDLKNQQKLMRAEGTVAGQNENESATTSGNALKLAGSIGANPTDLSIGLDKKSKTVTLDGKLGQVDAHLTLTPSKDKQDFTIQGTLGGVPYKADAKLDADITLSDDDVKAPKQDPGPGFVGDPGDGQDDPQAEQADKTPPQDLGKIKPAGTMTVRGSLGDQALSRDYQVSIQPLGAGLNILFDGQGKTAGVPEDVHVKLGIIA